MKSLIYVQMPAKNWHENAIQCLADAAEQKSTTFTITINKNGAWQFRNGFIKAKGKNFISEAREFLSQLYPEYKTEINSK